VELRRKFCRIEIYAHISLRVSVDDEEPAHIVNTTIGPAAFVGAIANETIWPRPLHMLDCAPRLHGHDGAQTAVACGRGAVADREVAASVVAVQEYGDVVDRARAIVRIRRQAQLAVGGEVERHLESIYISDQSTALFPLRRWSTPPPSGVPGCGASSIAKPGVKIWPLDTVKFWAAAQAASSNAAITVALTSIVE
jgi:hypothetical protein